MAFLVVRVRRWRSRWAMGVAAGLIIHACAMTDAAAQAQSRADEIAAKQAEKATRLQPYEPTRIEQALSKVERRFTDPPRWSVTFDSVYAGARGGVTRERQAEAAVLSEEYTTRATSVARRRVALAGYRLADLLIQ